MTRFCECWRYHQAFVWSNCLVGFEHILKVMPHLLSEKVQQLYYVTRLRFLQVGLGISCPILYMILCGHTHVWQLKNLMLLTFSFYTSFGRWNRTHHLNLITQPVVMKTQPTARNFFITTLNLSLNYYFIWLCAVCVRVCVCVCVRACGRVCVFVRALMYVCNVSLPV